MSEHAQRTDIIQPRTAEFTRRTVIKVLEGTSSLLDLQDIVNLWLDGLDGLYPGWQYNVLQIEYREDGVGASKKWYAILHMYWTGPTNPSEIPSESSLP